MHSCDNVNITHKRKIRLPFQQRAYVEMCKLAVRRIYGQGPWKEATLWAWRFQRYR